METLHCSVCNHPTFHQTTNLYGQQVHPQGVKCLRCGKFSGEPSDVIRLPQKATWRIERDEVVRWV